VTDSNYRHLIIVQDRSGSIESILYGMQSGYEEFIRRQMKDKIRTTVSVWQFDDVIECVYSFKTLDEVVDYEIVPRDLTALNDAVMEATATEGEQLAAMPENQRPGSVTLLIDTDGLENRSIKYPKPHGTVAVAKALKHQQEAYNWGVIYLGTNHDVFTQSESLGVYHDTSLSYAGTNAGAKSAWKMSSSNYARGSVSVASAGGASCDVYSFTDQQRAEAESMVDDSSGDVK